MHASRRIVVVDDSFTRRLERRVAWIHGGSRGFLAGRELRDRGGRRGARRVLDLRKREFPFGGPERPDADGIVGSEPGVLGVISGADCVPAFLLDRARRCWAIVHAGWRGVEAGVLPEAVRVLTGGERKAASRLELYLGPSICGECYEVGEDVAARLSEAGGSAGVERRGESWYANLRLILKVQARESGLAEGAVSISEFCTRCHNDLFCSYRAEGREGLGRMWGVIGFRPPGSV